VYPTISEEDYRYILADCDAKMVIIDGALRSLVYSFDSLDRVAELLLEYGFDSALDGSLSVRAACAVTLQLYEYDLVVIGVVYEFNVAAVPLKERPDLFQNADDLFSHFISPFYYFRVIPYGPV